MTVQNNHWAIIGSKMDENLRQRLLAASSNASLTFPQEFRLPFGDALVDASVCCGAEARPLSGVVDQPSMFPKGGLAVYVVARRIYVNQIPHEIPE